MRARTPWRFLGTSLVVLGFGVSVATVSAAIGPGYTSSAAQVQERDASMQPATGFVQVAQRSVAPPPPWERPWAQQSEFDVHPYFRSGPRARPGMHRPGTPFMPAAQRIPVCGERPGAAPPNPRFFPPGSFPPPFADCVPSP